MTSVSYRLGLELFILVSVLGNEDKDRQLGIFNIVTFPNTVCTVGQQVGTCYTSDECKAKGGTINGNCASGFGVCCIVSIGCNGKSSENSTYFQSKGGEIDSCTATICKSNFNVCQLRLDFEAFTIAGPSTSSVSIGKILSGLDNNDGVEVSSFTQCNSQSFRVINEGSVTPPVICGINTLEHMIVNFGSSDCISLSFMLGAIPAVPTSWKIKTLMRECNDTLLAPPGCTQYIYGTLKGFVSTYNYLGDVHLANQKQRICVRTELSQCRICWSTQKDDDFQVSGMEEKGLLKDTACCNYGKDGKGTLGYDCLNIGGASSKDSLQLLGGNFCGRSKGLPSKDGDTVSKTICSRQMPFMITFYSDNYEFTGAKKEATRTNKGFKLYYEQKNCISA